ncbi:MAG: hypothetical protein Ct9H300mP11_24620 [Chloroflexota bacterium]|nr:MAG: hypothetical protein Ct9H300mP11_24620 [Chloroflexota bacterium]
MPLHIDKNISNWVDVCWSEHRSESALKIWQRAKEDWGEECPSRRWVSDRVRALKSRVRELDPEPIPGPGESIGLRTRIAFKFYLFCTMKQIYCALQRSSGI